MTREDILNEVLRLKGNNWLLELPTGTGKSKIAIDKAKSLCNNIEATTILIAVPRNIHKQNWEDEINKWWPECRAKITYTTYMSLPMRKGKYDIAIFDEGHHISERCRKALKDFDIKYNIILSATVTSSMKEELSKIFKGLTVYSKSLRDVIDSNILPDPIVYLIPLKLRNDIPTESIWKNKRAKGRIIDCSWVDRWSYIHSKNPVRIYCTEQQYYSDLCQQIDYWKKRYMKNKNALNRNMWLRLCNDRLKWLSDKKILTVYEILKSLKHKRTITFCNNISQTEALGRYCINSKNKDSINNYNDFNEGKIDHITACNMLNESMNLNNCQVGIFANLNASDILTRQRNGRLLRHKEPIIIVPYYSNTREEELVNKMTENYNPKLIKTINDIKLIKI